MAYPYTYASVADVQARYDSDYLDRICNDSATGTANYDRLMDGLSDATGEIDSYLSSVYQLPLDPVPALLKRMCMDMAIYHTAITSDKMTEELAARYKGWVSHLDKIASRKVGLGIPVGQPTSAVDTNGQPILASSPTEGSGSNAASSGRTQRI